jgi:hypothetical protein
MAGYHQVGGARVAGDDRRGVAALGRDIAPFGDERLVRREIGKRRVDPLRLLPNALLDAADDIGGQTQRTRRRHHDDGKDMQADQMRLEIARQLRAMRNEMACAALIVQMKQDGLVGHESVSSLNARNSSSRCQGDER